MRGMKFIALWAIALILSLSVWAGLYILALWLWC